jgi:hypothetical protein
MFILIISGKEKISRAFNDLNILICNLHHLNVIAYDLLDSCMRGDNITFFGKKIVNRFLPLGLTN